MESQESRKLKASLEKAQSLNVYAEDFLEARERIPAGFKQAKAIEENKKRIAKT